MLPHLDLCLTFTFQRNVSTAHFYEYKESSCLIEKSKSSYLSLSYFCFCVFVSIFVVVGRAFEDTVVSCKGCYYGAATATGSAAPKPRPALKSTLVKKPSCQYQKWDFRTKLSFHMNALFIHSALTCLLE